MDGTTSIGLSLRVIRVEGGDEEMGGAMDLRGESEGGTEGKSVPVGEKQRLQLLIRFEGMEKQSTSEKEENCFGTVKEVFILKSKLFFFYFFQKKSK